MREKDNLQFRIGHLETERSFLKRHIDLMVPNSRMSMYTPSSAKENLYRGGEEVSSFSRSISRGFDGRARGSIFNGADRSAVDNENARTHAGRVSVDNGGVDERGCF